MSAQPDYFSKYLPKQSTSEPKEVAGFEEKKPQKEDKEKSFSFDSYLPDKAPEESKFESLLRQSTQYASRALERVGGFIPDAKKFVSDLILESYEKADLGFDEIVSEEKKREAPERLKNLFSSNPEVSGSLPGTMTSPELRESSEKISGGYTTPKTPAEEKIGNVVGDITSSLLGGKKSIKNNLLVPIGANLIESGLEMTGFDKKAQAYGKQGAWFLLGSAANTNANEFAFKLRDEARKGIPTVSTDMNSLGRELRPLERKWISGDLRSASSKDQINHIIKDIKQGKTSIHDLITRIDAINAEIDFKGGFDYSFKVPKTVRKAEIKNLKELKSALYDTMKDTLKNEPEKFKKFMESQEVLAAISQSNRLVDFAKKHVVKSVSIGLASLLGGAYFDPTLSIAGGAALLGLHKAGQVVTRISKSPALSKYYLNSIKAVSENNVPVFIQNMEALDKALKKEEQKKKPPYKFQES